MVDRQSESTQDSNRKADEISLTPTGTLEATEPCGPCAPVDIDETPGLQDPSAWRPGGSLWQHATPFLRRLRAIGTYKRPTKPLSYRSRSQTAPALAGGGRDLRAYRIYRRESMTTILINGTETLDEKEFSHG